MRVCGMDLGRPGGVVVLSDEGPGKPRVLAAVALGARLSGLELQRLVHRLAKEHGVELMATERPGAWGRAWVGMAQREKQGLVRAVCEALQIRLVDYQPQEIKKAVTGHGRADKEQVGRCVQMLVPIASENEHVLDACAIALVAINRERTRRNLEGQRKMGLPLRTASGFQGRERRRARRKAR